MQPKTTPGQRKAFFLLFACILCLVAGITVLTLGAVLHVNPRASFAGLFRLQPYINLVYSIVT